MSVVLQGFANPSLNGTYFQAPISLGGHPTYWTSAWYFFIYYQTFNRKWSVAPRDAAELLARGEMRGVALECAAHNNPSVGVLAGWRPWLEHRASTCFGTDGKWEHRMVQVSYMSAQSTSTAVKSAAVSFARSRPPAAPGVERLGGVATGNKRARSPGKRPSRLGKNERKKARKMAQSAQGSGA